MFQILKDNISFLQNSCIHVMTCFDWSVYQIQTFLSGVHLITSFSRKSSFIDFFFDKKSVLHINI